MRLFLIAFILFVAVAATADDQVGFEENYVLYEGETDNFIIDAPDHWYIDIENASKDGYTAAIFADTESYNDPSMIIYVWVYHKDSLSFQEFISEDSAYYIKRDAALTVASADTVLTDQGKTAVVFEMENPGMGSETAAIGYIDAGPEIVIYELDVRRLDHFLEGNYNFREAIWLFKVVGKETE
ncbi:MAG: hypothetical protein CVT49_02940 [candidate division Zixibacteria bacterium HGW-Zixibacteria-1]|nr:MAG: hypothetical protein CVT49_02940 [candidate division Zixibacteria bacterium HGW-Zixibacteria-1]